MAYVYANLIVQSLAGFNFFFLAKIMYIRCTLGTHQAHIRYTLLCSVRGLFLARICAKGIVRLGSMYILSPVCMCMCV